jgi:hypothetical protein
VEVGRHEAGLAVVGQQLAEVLADALPGGGSGCHERVEDRGSEHFHVGVGEPGGACSAGGIEDEIPDGDTNARLGSTKTPYGRFSRGKAEPSAPAATLLISRPRRRCCR